MGSTTFNSDCDGLVFATIPSLEAKLAVCESGTKDTHFIIIDLTKVHRLDTSAVEFLETKLRESFEGHTIIFSGIMHRSPAAMDLQRGGISLDFSARWSASYTDPAICGPLAFQYHADAVEWCRYPGRHIVRDDPTVAVAPSSGTCTLAGHNSRLQLTSVVSDIASEAEAMATFMRRRSARGLSHALFPGFVESIVHDSEQLSTIIAQFLNGCGRVGHYQPGQLLQVKGKPKIKDTTCGNADEDRQTHGMYLLFKDNFALKKYS